MTVLFVGVTGRMVSSLALLSTLPAPRSRGAFMSVSSSLQQVAGGAAAALAGWIVTAPQTGPLQNDDRIGWIVVGVSLINMGLRSITHRKVTPRTAALASSPS